jgi:Xaa-Pro aminopeptidase
MHRCLTFALLCSLSSATAAHGQISPAEYAARREALASRLGDGVFVARGASEPAVDYMAFYQSPGFFYLTGYKEAEASLLMQKKGTTVNWTLFVEAKNPAQEVWSGRRNGIEVASRVTGLTARLNNEFRASLDSSLQGASKLYVLSDLAESGDTLNGDDRFAQDIRSAHPTLSIESANSIVARLRAKKSAAELELFRRAAAVSMEAHREAARALQPGMNEFEIHALLDYTFRRNGGDRPAYASIVGSGPNSTTLHYSRNDRYMVAGDLLLIDAATAYGGYAADVTRTFPVNGKFTPEQRDVYQIVRNAQAAAERQIKIGGPFRALSDSASVILAAGLTRLGLIEGPDATYECTSEGETRRCSQLSLYYMHGLGHGIGLEVHDPDQAYYTGRVDVGSAFTIEPGIYVRENLLDIIPKSEANAKMIEKIRSAVMKYRNVGVRIEDDFIVSENGVEWVSCVPRELDEVEAMMRDHSATPAPRDAERVDWYKATGAPPPDAAKLPAPAKPKACSLKM